MSGKERVTLPGPPASYQGGNTKAHQCGACCGAKSLQHSELPTIIVSYEHMLAEREVFEPLSPCVLATEERERRQPGSCPRFDRSRNAASRVSNLLFAERSKLTTAPRPTNLTPGKSVKICGIDIPALPGAHGVSEFTSLLRSGGNSVYFGGDTLLTPEVHAIAGQGPGRHRAGRRHQAAHHGQARRHERGRRHRVRPRAGREGGLN